MMDRIISLIDMDCFYVQVEQLSASDPTLYKGKPCGVQQYNKFKRGGLIAVNYEARKFGVKRGMPGDDAKKLCPDFHVFHVEEKRGKANLDKYRDASSKIFQVLTKHCQVVEKASIDEAYLDLTDKVNERLQDSNHLNKKPMDILPFIERDSFVITNHSMDQKDNLKQWLSFIVDLSSDSFNAKLAIGAQIVKEIRDDIEKTLGYHCSAGIAHNKVKKIKHKKRKLI
jgi:DNA polymerase eta